MVDMRWRWTGYSGSGLNHNRWSRSQREVVSTSGTRAASAPVVARTGDGYGEVVAKLTVKQSWMGDDYTYLRVSYWGRKLGVRALMNGLGACHITLGFSKPYYGTAIGMVLEPTAISGSTDSISGCFLHTKVVLARRLGGRLFRENAPRLR
ncbi:hypothetical protein BD779DRAFT_1472297 [Infundibulicybe gibba]|nr:hypothetical protein BD779DRAFT_1472297 [Infundibulicybe gibba]